MCEKKPATFLIQANESIQKINRVFKKLKLQVKLTNQVIEFKPTFKGHSIITYLNHASTKDVISTQNQCQIWICYFKEYVLCTAEYCSL